MLLLCGILLHIALGVRAEVTRFLATIEPITRVETSRRQAFLCFGHVIYDDKKSGERCKTNY